MNDFEMGMFEATPHRSGIEVIKRRAAFKPQHLDHLHQGRQFADAAQREMKLLVDGQRILEIR
jgi:hypothetical protein